MTDRPPGAALGAAAVTAAGFVRAAGLAGAAAFAAVAWGASAGPHLFDAGEIVAASAQLGASHPPGQPLHALVAHAAVLVPLGPIAWRVACVSALFGVLAAIAGARIVLEAAPGSNAPGSTVAGSRVPALAALVAIPIAPAIAPQLGRPEVYTLALFLTLEGTRRLLAWARGEASGLRGGALCAGLAVAVHPPHALALLAIGAALLASARRDALARPRALAWAALACIVGMLTLAYLPLRGAAGAPMWGEPTSPAGLWDYLSASAYRRNLGTEDGSALGNALEVIAYVLVPGGLGALVAIVPLRRAALRRPIALLAVAASAAIVAACLQRLEPANPDNVAYAGPAAALFVALGLASVAALGSAGIAASRTGALATTTLATGALVVLAVASGDVAALRQGAPQLETLAFLAVDAPPPRALVIPRTDFVAAAWMEAREVEGARPDVALLVQGLATSSWHWRTLRDHPPFDGTPVRSGPGSGTDPWVRGAIARARPALPIVAEDDGPLGGRGVVLGPYLLLAGSEQARVDRSFAERTFGAPARMIPFTPPGHAGAAHGVIRDAEIARARRLFARDRAALAIAGLSRAAAPLDAAAIAPALGVEGSPSRQPPPVLHDPDAIYATADDAVRDLSSVLVSLGAVDRAIALLALQGERGDDRALLQVAWIHHTLGRDDAARATLDAYRALHPERTDEIGQLAAALERSGGSGPAAPDGSP